MRRPRSIESQSALSNDHLGVLGTNAEGREIEVVDVMFNETSIFTRYNGWGLWPQVEDLCGFVMRRDYPKPENVVSVVRWKMKRGSVYRMFIIREKKDG